MKKTLTFILFALPIICFSQNWSLINANDQYHYKSDTADYISNTIFADSLAVNGNDTLFYLNRVVKNCPQCDTAHPKRFKIANQGQFLQKEITKLSDGSYRFVGDREFFLYPHWKVGQPWIFDTVQNSIAQIDTIYTGEVFGVPDSIKRVSTDVGDIITISKNYGIIEFSNTEEKYTLQGIEGPDVGEILPTKADFYNFSVGDVFQYETTNWGILCSDIAIEKHIVLDKDETSSHFIYSVRVITKGEKQSIYNYETYYKDSVHSMPYSKNSGMQKGSYPYNAYNNMLVESAQCENDGFRIVKITKNAATGRVSVRRAEAKSGTGSGFERGYGFINNSDTLAQLGMSSYYEICVDAYTTSLGKVLTHEEILDNYNRKVLTAYVKDGDTTGIIIPDTDLISSTSIDITNAQFAVYPTYSNGYYTIHFQEATPPYSFNVYTMNGRLVLHGENQFGGDTQIDLSDKSAGVYFLKVESRGIADVYKLVKR